MGKRKFLAYRNSNSNPSVGRMREKRNAYRILVGKPRRKEPLGRPRLRWVDSIKMDLREIGWGGMDRIDLAHDRTEIKWDTSAVGLY
jgi:hypothetical protein